MTAVMRTATMAPIEIWSASSVIAHHLLHTGYTFITTYPGSPTTLIADELDTLARRGLVSFRYGTNEKVAFEMAAAVALMGGRAAVFMKHVGLNVALDSAMGIAFTGQRGALLLIVGDDPSCDSSSNEQDSRLVARLMSTPCLEPASVEDLPRTLDLATRLSEETGGLAMLRLTTALCYSSAPLAYRPVSAAPQPRALSFPERARRFLLTPAIARENTPQVLDRLRAAERAGEQREFWEESPGNGGLAFVLQNTLYEPFQRACAELGIDPPVWRSRLAWPVASSSLRDFLARHARVVVLEEMQPLLEEQAAVLIHRENLQSRIEPSGRPRHGRIDAECLTELLAKLLGEPAGASAGATEPRPPHDGALLVPPRPPTFCAGCPHTASFYALKRVVDSLPQRPFIASDIGCYTLGTKAGIEMGDVVLCMGASIGIATGVALTGRKTLALIGDSTFFHAGLPALKNAIDQQANLVICLFDNGVAAMTGGQATAAPEARLEQVALGLGATVRVVDPFQPEQMAQVLRTFLDSPGVSMLIARSPCALTVPPQPRRPKVDLERCNGCGDCVTRIHCPAISLSPTTRKFEVQLDVCVGCGFCSTICPQGALTPVPYRP
jgi:indolepyruvate ferredoxin oxidoreductase alpha subunit